MEALESAIKAAEGYRSLVEGYEKAIDQLVEDLAFATGTPRQVLLDRYLRPVADVVSGR